MDHDGRYVFGHCYLSPLFGKLLSISDEKSKVEIAGKAEINTSIKPIAHTENSLRTVSTKHCLKVE
jgi:hypothetical protein